MAGEWTTTKLSSLCSYLNRGAAPAYTNEHGVAVLNQKCVRDQRVSFVEARRTDPDLKPISPDRLLRRWDVLVNSTGVGTLGRVAQIDVLPEPATVDSHVTIARPNSEAVVPRYLGFVLRAFETEIEALAEGSTGQTELSRSRLGSLVVPVAPEDEQRAIADILGTLDDKIELNRRMSETLEAMARALFKSWFVDFDPVRAKAEGRARQDGARSGQPRKPLDVSSDLPWPPAEAGAGAEGDPGLPKPLADLFPARLVDSELGEIPAGWEVRPLNDLLELAYGKALKAEDRNNGMIPVYGSNGQVGWHNEQLTTGPGIVVGRKGNPGVVTWAPKDFFVIDTAFYVVSKFPCPSLHFLFHALRLQNLTSLGADSAVPGLNRNLAYMSKQLLPSFPVLERFEKLVRPLTERVHCLELESRTIAALRDTLLPKLISGELQSKDANRLIEETT